MSAGQVAAELKILRAPSRRRSRSVRVIATVVFPAVLLGIFVGAGIFAPLIAPHDPREISLLDRFIPPIWQSGGDWSHPLGTDHLGRDILSRLIYGDRISLLVVGITIPISALVGTTIGVLAGFRLGTVDRVFMRLVDVQLAMPAILFAVLLAAVFGPSLTNVLVIIMVWTWGSYARLVRGEALSLRERDFIQAARATGASDGWIIIRHIVPNILNAVVIVATLEIALVILLEAGLSFLGVGVALGTPSWGAMVSEGRTYMTLAWWIFAIPGVAILLVSLSGNLVGDWLRDRLDPRLRGVR